MLNWIAIWVGSVPLRARRPAPERRARRPIPISTDVADSAKLPVFWGDPLLQGLHIGFFLAIAALVVYWIVAQPHDARLRGPRRRLQPRGRALRRHQRRAELLPRDGDRRPLRRARRARSTSSAGSSGSTSTISRARRSASSASPSRCSAATRAIGVGLSALLFGALLTGTSSRNLDPTVFQPDLADNLTMHHPGPRRALRGRGPARDLPLAGAQEAGLRRPPGGDGRMSRYASGIAE